MIYRLYFNTKPTEFPIIKIVERAYLIATIEANSVSEVIKMTKNLDKLHWDLNMDLTLVMICPFEAVRESMPGDIIINENGEKYIILENEEFTKYLEETTELINEQSSSNNDLWTISRPLAIQGLLEAYPSDVEYIIKENAPFAISCPGTKVGIISYREEGDVKIIIPHENKLPSAIEHEKQLLNKIGKIWEPSSTMFIIDPVWLEPLKK